MMMDFAMHSPGRPKPKAGYKCKICGKPGGKPDSHWYQLCPSRGTPDDQRPFNPPRKGYICKFCHKVGGEPDSHWFQQCPKRHEFEGIQVPHPLKVRGIMPGFMTPQQSLAAQAAAMMNIGVLPSNLQNLPMQGMSSMQGLQPQYDYQQQFNQNSAAMFMYPNTLLNNQMNLNQAAVNQQQLYFLQQQQLSAQNADTPNGSNINLNVDALNAYARNVGGNMSGGGPIIGNQGTNLNVNDGNMFNDTFQNKGVTGAAERDFNAYYQDQFRAGMGLKGAAGGQRGYGAAFDVGRHDSDQNLLSSITNRAQNLKISNDDNVNTGARTAGSNGDNDTM